MSMVSFIVPCYNSSATIERCIDSILAQTFSNIELIIIDDGSADDTVALVQNYKKRDPRIKLIKQKHGGPNMAREAGVKKASGEYIMFVDSDDYIVEDAVEILIKAIKKYNVDYIRFNGINTNNGTIVQPILNINDNSKIIDSREIIELLLTSYRLNSICLQIYKANNIKKIKAFDSSIVFGEDFLVNLEIHQNTDKMLILSGKPLYYYCDNPDSTTRSIDKEKILGNISDRVYVSGRAICYAQSSIKDIRFRNEILYAQLKMVKSCIMGLHKIRDYTKRSFLEDYKRIMDKNDYMERVNVCELKEFITTLSLLDRIKNKKIIVSMLEGRPKNIWFYVMLLKMFRGIRW